MHIIFNDQYEVVGEIYPLVDAAPCHASFSRDGKLLTLSSFMLYNGSTLAVPVSRFPGLSVSSEDLEEHWFSKDTVTEMRKGLQDLDRDLVLVDADVRITPPPGAATSSFLAMPTGTYERSTRPANSAGSTSSDRA